MTGRSAISSQAIGRALMRSIAMSPRSPNECSFITARTDESIDLAFGLCDLGLGWPELGHVDLTKLGLPIERDLHFEADKTISAYADEAREHGRIVT